MGHHQRRIVTTRLSIPYSQVHRQVPSAARHFPSFRCLQLFAKLQTGKEDIQLSKQKSKNHLAHYRRRLHLSQEKVAALLGQKRRGLIWEYESGQIMPSLSNVLRLAAIYRAPVEFLFRELFLKQQQEVRNLEQAIGPDIGSVL